MRINSGYTAVCFLCLCILSSCVYHHNNHHLKISVEESGSSYIFSAFFPESKTGKVHRIVNNSLSPNGLFGSVNDYMDVTTTLQDKTTFAVKASPGIIYVRVDRQGNSPASYDRIKEMCAAIKRSLKD
jgi:hypothetical protein